MIKWNVKISKCGQPGPLFIFHHGGGHSGDTFEVLTQALQQRMSCDVLTFDCRGHGSTFTENDSDLSLERLVLDLRDVIDQYGKDAKEIILVGHSMGAAVVVELMNKYPPKGILGTVVLDVVEGTALEDLSHMHTFLRSRPTSFKTIKDAIDWSIRSKQLKNRKSAEISVPSQLVQTENGFTWRTDLRASSSHWSGWFTGMSEKFIKIRGARLLILAGTDRLDKTLTIGQMQGKFQMEILTESGHVIQEDEPEKLADILSAFYKRNQPLDISKIRKPLTTPTE